VDVVEGLFPLLVSTVLLPVGGTVDVVKGLFPLLVNTVLLPVGGTVDVLGVPAGVLSLRLVGLFLCNVVMVVEVTVQSSVGTVV